MQNETKLCLAAFCGALSLFIFHKIPLLDTPLFWDEMGVYAKGIFYMNDHSVSLLPSALPPNVSRGHPLMFTFIYALFSELFAINILGLRCISLILFSTLIWYTYSLIKQNNNAFTSCAFSIIILSQGIISAHSITVLPEILLGFTSLIAILSITQRKYTTYLIFSSIAVLTKEPGIFLPSVCFLFYLLNKEYKLSLFCLIPLSFFGLFLVLQKLSFGWFLFPYHSGGFELDPAVLIPKLKRNASFIFYEQGRLIWPLFLMLFVFTKKYWQKNKEPLSISFLLGITILLFYSTTYEMSRYLIIIILLACYQLSIILDIITKLLKPIYKLACLAPFILFGLIFARSESFVYDEDLSFVDFALKSKNMIDYLYQEGLTNEKCYMNWPLSEMVSSHNFGYLQKGQKPMAIGPMDFKTKYAIINRQGARAKIPNGVELEKAYEFKFEVFESYIYKVKPTVNVQFEKSDSSPSGI